MLSLYALLSTTYYTTRHLVPYISCASPRDKNVTYLTEGVYTFTLFVTFVSSSNLHLESPTALPLSLSPFLPSTPSHCPHPETHEGELFQYVHSSHQARKHSKGVNSWQKVPSTAQQRFSDSNGRIGRSSQDVNLTVPAMNTNKERNEYSDR